MGRRGVEDHRRAHRQRVLALLFGGLNGQRMMGLNNIELITDRPIEINLREIAEVKKRYPEARGDRVADGGVEARSVARYREARGRRRRRRPGTELRLPARHERTRHGQRGGSGARLCQHDHRMGERSGAHAGAGQAHAEHHRHPHCGARGQARRRRRAFRHQHDQFDYRNRSGYA